MSTLKNVVVAIDTSIMAKEVLKRAFSIAKTKNINLNIIHVIDIPWFSTLSNKDEIIKNTKDKIENDISNINEDNLYVNVIVKEGNPSEKIVEEARLLDASLIIIGAYSKENLKSMILGSNAHNIAQKSRLPVLIVKNLFACEYENALAFTDLSDISKRSIVFAKEFFPSLDYKLVYAKKNVSDFALAYYNMEGINDPNIEEMQQANVDSFIEFSKEVKISNKELLEGTNSSTGLLLNYAQDHDKDLVILGSSGVRSASTFLFGSTTSTLMKSLSSDVLVYVPQD